MSSRFPASLLAMALLLVACEREERESRGRPLPESGPSDTLQPTLIAGEPDAMPASDPRAKAYEANAFHINEGQRLYQWFNCVGCHAHGGGGMGPALIDDEWRYGGSMSQIYATIAQGRPNGMPSFRNKLTEQQIWQLAAYVRAMSGQPPKDAVPSRGDEMSNTEPMTLAEPQPVKSGDSAGVQGTAQ